MRSVIRDSYQPAASIRLHVTISFDGFGVVIVNINGVNAALLIAVLHDLSAVHGERVQDAN